jgi:drug/metabolite transporter (DMT)-like permease
MPVLTFFWLALGVLAVSTAAPLIKLIPHVPALVVAAYRLTLAAAALLIVARPHLHTRPGGCLDRRGLWLALGAGASLALHFVFWIASLRYTSVASSVVLVTLSPLFLAAAGYVLWGERLGPSVLLGIGLATVGGVCIGWEDAGGFAGSEGARSPLFGDALALCGAVMASAYLLFGRFGRQRLTLRAYVAVAYAFAALLLVAASLARKAPLLDYSPKTYAVLVALALVPQLVGHTIFNWALGYLSPTLIALAIVGEPVGATLLALVLLGESVSWLKALGALSALTGIVLAYRSAAFGPR